MVNIRCLLLEKMEKFRLYWNRVRIKDKFAAFTGSVFITILVVIIFDLILLKLFVIDVNDIMEDNSHSGTIISAIDKERECFNLYINNRTDENRDALNLAIKNTERAINRVELDYHHLGENRYAQLFALKTTYDVYCENRDEVLDKSGEKNDYLIKLYDVYSMQDYLYEYAQGFIDLTLKEGNAKYVHLIPKVYIIPIVAVTMSGILFLVVVTLSRAMNRSITKPVLHIASASRRIAANDFFIDDVKTENQDEIGELVKAFNKMKYATGEYIMALEKRREALDKLHAQEVQTLEVEKQLDAMKLDLLKSQINPHFLFNTLNVIGGMANLEDAKTTEQMIKALSSIFRYNLKNQEKKVPLSLELKVADDYMYLQKMRFGERVNYTVKSRVEPERVMVPTFTLQPLLENSIIHGISPKLKGGSVTVEVSKEENTQDGKKAPVLQIVVSDTGNGFDKDNFSMGIGMGNINSRLRAMYKDANMEIDSKNGEGTSIKISLPYEEEVEYSGG